MYSAVLKSGSSMEVSRRTEAWEGTATPNVPPPPPPRGPTSAAQAYEVSRAEVCKYARMAGMKIILFILHYRYHSTLR